MRKKRVPASSANAVHGQYLACAQTMEAECAACTFRPEERALSAGVCVNAVVCGREETLAGTREFLL